MVNLIYRYLAAATLIHKINNYNKIAFRMRGTYRFNNLLRITRRHGRVTVDCWLQYTLPDPQNNIIFITFVLLLPLFSSRDAGMFLDNVF
jgi:hypothetical protein